MRNSGEEDSRARDESLHGNVSATDSTQLRDECINALIEGAPEFPMEEIAEELILKMQGGLRGHVRDRDLN